MWRKLKFQFQYSFELYQKIFSRKQSTNQTKYSKYKKTMSAGLNHDHSLLSEISDGWESVSRSLGVLR